MANKKIYIRNKLGRFQSLDPEKGQLNQKLYAVPVGGTIEEAARSGLNKIIEAARLGKAVDDFDLEYEIYNNQVVKKSMFVKSVPMEERTGDYFNPNPSWKIPTYDAKGDKKDPYKMAKMGQEDFVFSYSAQRAYGLSEKEQRANFLKLQEANVLMKEVIEKTGGMLGYEFSYNMNRPAVDLEKTLKRANQLLAMGVESYIESQVATYRSDFLEKMRNIVYDPAVRSDEDEKRRHIEEDLFNEFEHAINLISPTQFFQVLSVFSKTSAAYSIYSTVGDFGRMVIERELEFITERIYNQEGYNK